MAREIFDDEWFVVDEKLGLKAHVWTEGNQLVIHKGEDFEPLVAIDFNTLDYVEYMEDNYTRFYTLDQLDEDERAVIKEFVNFMRTAIIFGRRQ